jgi:hypothetical protein
MITNLTHKKIFLYSLRTALLIVAGFFVYDILKEFENDWNKTHPENKLNNLAQNKIIHFIVMFLIDVIILYLIVLLIKNTL